MTLIPDHPSTQCCSNDLVCSSCSWLAILIRDSNKYIDTFIYLSIHSTNHLHFFNLVFKFLNLQWDPISWHLSSIEFHVEFNLNVYTSFTSCNNGLWRTNKAGYTATEVACGWAGAIFEVTRPFGQERWCQKHKIIKKSKVWPTNRPTDRPTDRRTKRVVESRARN